MDTNDTSTNSKAVSTRICGMSSIELLKILKTTEVGLTNEEAKKRFGIYGANRLKGEETTPSYRDNIFTILLSQFRNPLLVIFLFISGLYFFVGSPEDALIIITILLTSTIVAVRNDRAAVGVIKKLLKSIQRLSTALRNGKEEQIPFEYIVPGDIIILKAGDSIPADSLILESKDLFANESALTGERYPVEKTSLNISAGSINNISNDFTNTTSPPAAVSSLQESSSRFLSPSLRTNSLFLGTFVVSGFAKAVVVETGANTRLGKISRLRIKPAENEFEKNVRSFGYFLLEVTSVMVIALLSINSFLGSPIIESLLFSLALSIGLTPQLLPAIITVSLAKGAKNMAIHRAIVRRLPSIESLGSMNILCSDKIGTLTIGEVKLQSAEDVEGNANNKVLLYAYLNAIYETGFTNPMDKAIKEFGSLQFDISNYLKLDEIPYDFIRKRLSIFVLYSEKETTTITKTLQTAKTAKKSVLVTKGAFYNILEVCSYAEVPDGTVVDISIIKQKIQLRFEELSNKGLRILAICYREISCSDRDNISSTSLPSLISKDDEINMTFLGFLVFSDPIKHGLVKSISNLKNLGIAIKVLSGDNRHVAAYVGQQVGLDNSKILMGSEINFMTSEALKTKVVDTDIFAEIEPNQKEQIILALKKGRKKIRNDNDTIIADKPPIIGYLGDGINDASAIHAADIGISVDTAADVIKEAADTVLLQKDLMVLIDGILEGRKTLTNTLKYIFMATSSNFGNVVSMAGASLLLPFLPLLPKQILLTNLLIDIPEMALSTDEVYDKMVKDPRRLDMKLIRNFMLLFGGLVTVFDFFMFGILVLILHTTVGEFRTAWFIESVISACVIVLIIRNERPYSSFSFSFIRNNKPGKLLIISVIVVATFSVAAPFIPLFANLFELIKLHVSFYIIIVMFELLYVLSAEVMKKFFYMKVERSH